MAETTADVRREIEVTRERMSSTISQLERKVNVIHMVREHPWPAMAAAVAAGVLLSGAIPLVSDEHDGRNNGSSRPAPRSQLGSLFNKVALQLTAGVAAALSGHVDRFVQDITTAIGPAPPPR